MSEKKDNTPVWWSNSQLNFVTYNQQEEKIVFHRGDSAVIITISRDREKDKERDDGLGYFLLIVEKNTRIYEGEYFYLGITFTYESIFFAFLDEKEKVSFGEYSGFETPEFEKRFKGFSDKIFMKEGIYFRIGDYLNIPYPNFGVCNELNIGIKLNEKNRRYIKQFIDDCKEKDEALAE